MRRFRRRLGAAPVAIAGALLFTGLAGAEAAAGFAIDPQCEVFKRPRAQVNCTCALKSGGWIFQRPDGRPGFKVARPTTKNQRSIRNPAFDQCEHENGGDTP